MKHCAVFLRLKGSCNSVEIKKIFSIVQQKNFFICNDFSANNISYRLANEAHVICSPQSTIAEEALVFGKRVLLLDNLFTVSKMVETIYPDLFKFAFVRNYQELIYKSKLIIQKNKKFLQKFLDLQAQLSTKTNFTDSMCVSKALEAQLKK